MVRRMKTEKPRWLEEREEAGRSRFPNRLGTPARHTLEQQVTSVPVKEGAGSNRGVSPTYNSVPIPPVSNGSAVQHGSGQAAASPNRIPRWAYALIGAAAAAIIYASGAAAGVFPNILASTQQPKPAATAQTSRVAPAADRLATVRRYQTELAQIIESQPWFADGINQNEQAFLNNVVFKLGKPNTAYLSDKLAINGNEKPIAVIYDAGLEDVAKKTVKYLQEKIPQGQAFFGLPISWTMLSVELHKVEAENSFGGGASEGGIAVIIIKASDFSGLEDTVGHEGGGHLIVDQDGKGRPVWYGETSAEIGNYFSSGGEWALNRTLSNLEYSRGKRLKTKPLSQFTLDDHLGINGRKATSEHITEGLDLLLSYRQMVGHASYQRFVGDVDAIARTREVTNSDIRSKMLLHTPDNLKPKAEGMYDSAVFGK